MSNRGRSRSPVSGKLFYLHISNIPFDKNWQDLKKLVKDECDCVGFVEIYNDSHDRSCGTGHIGFKSSKDAAIVLKKLNGYEYCGRRLVFRYELESDKKRWVETEEVYDPILPPHLPPPLLSSEMLIDIGFKGPITDSVFVNNIHPNTTKNMLREKFSEAGFVLSVEANRVKNGDTHFGIVRFKRPYEALVAISMFDRDIFCDREIRVRMDKEGGRIPLQEPLFPMNRVGSIAARIFLTEMKRRVSSRDVMESNFASHVVQLMMASMRPPPPAMPMIPPVPRLRGPVVPPFQNYSPREDPYDPRMKDDYLEESPLSHRHPARIQESFDDYDDRWSRSRMNASIDPYHPTSSNLSAGPSSMDRRPIDRPSRHSMHNAHEFTPETRPNKTIVNLLLAAIRGGISPAKLNTYASELGISQKEVEEIKKMHKIKDVNTSPRLLVRNLPFDFTEREMDRFFSPFGRIRALSINSDAQGRSLGYGYVEYQNPTEAATAMKHLNQTKVKDQVIRLDYD